MTDVLTATDYEVPGPGQYPVRIEEVEKRNGRYGPYYRLGTKVTEGEFEGMWVSFVASAKLTPAAKLRIAVEDIEGRKLKKGEQYDPKSLVGKEAIAAVSNETKDERTYANIEAFYPLPPESVQNDFRKAQESASEAKQPRNDDEDPEGDFDDIPL